MSEPMLELVNVTAGYGRSMVLHDVSLTVPVGGGVALMGHNGAGKTTLLRAAVGLLPVRSGKVLLNGEDVTKLRPNARVRRVRRVANTNASAFGPLPAAQVRNCRYARA